MAGNAHGLRQQKLRIGGAVAAAALLVQHLENIGVGGGLYREILPKALVPGKRGLQRPGIPPDAGLVIQMKGGRDLPDDFLCLVQGDKRGLLHGSLPLIRLGISMGRTPSRREGAGFLRNLSLQTGKRWHRFTRTGMVRQKSVNMARFYRGFRRLSIIFLLYCR